MDTNTLFNARNISSLKDMIMQSEQLFRDKTAFQIKNSDGNKSNISYKDLKNDIDSLGTVFIEMGLKNKFIAVIGENRYEWCLTYLATVCGTGVIVPLDKELPAGEIENLSKRSNIEAIIYSGKLESQINKIRPNLSFVKYFINMNLDNDDDGTLSFNKLLEKGRKLLEDGNTTYLSAEINPEEMSMLLFTSGTTDLAKGVMLSHKNICSNLMSVCKVLYIDSNDSVLSILPMHHTYECTCGFLLMLYNGCKISFCEGLKHIGNNLKEESPSVVILVPLILENMYKKIWDKVSKNVLTKIKLKFALSISNILLTYFNVDIRKRLFKKIHEGIGGNVRLIISGAAAIDPLVSGGLEAMGFKILQGYGLTECSPIVTVNQEENYRHDSIGLPLPGVEVKIDDADENGIGEILVKGDNVMLGYYKNQIATENVLKDGWLYTGDLARTDDSGFVYVTGRKKNLIVAKSGKNIFPEEVESYLNRSPYILESLVYGKLDENSGNILVNAKIVPDKEMFIRKLGKENISHEEFLGAINREVKIVNKNMPSYKSIKSFSIQDEEFAKTTTKKIKRHLQITG